MKLYYFHTLKALWDDQGKIKMYYGISRVKKQLSGKKVYYAYSLGWNHETTWLRVLKLIFVKRLIQRSPLNHYMRFNVNDLNVL